MKALTGDELKAARDAATARFLAVAEAIKAEAGVTKHRIRKGLSGFASANTPGVITAPEGRTRRQLYVLAHECGHVALNHVGANRDRSKPRHVEEMEAEQWAHAAMRRHGVPMPRKETERATLYVKHKVRQAKRRGAKKMDRAAMAYAGLREARPPRGASKDVEEVRQMMFRVYREHRQRQRPGDAFRA